MITSSQKIAERPVSSSERTRLASAVTVRMARGMVTRNHTGSKADGMITEYSYL